MAPKIPDSLTQNEAGFCDNFAEGANAPRTPKNLNASNASPKTIEALGKTKLCSGQVNNNKNFAYEVLIFIYVHSMHCASHPQKGFCSQSFTVQFNAPSHRIKTSACTSALGAFSVFPSTFFLADPPVAECVSQEIGKKVVTRLVRCSMHQCMHHFFGVGQCIVF